jgi:quercetin dioxygenase-like cupin family protein
MNATSTGTYPTIVSSFGYSPVAPALWRTDAVTGLDFRDLSLAQASGDAFFGRHLRTGGMTRETRALIATPTAFTFLFVLAGQVTLKEDGADPVTLRALDSATRQGPGRPVSVELSHDAEIMEMKANAAGTELFGPGDGRWAISHEAESDYRQGEGPRAYFRYRDLGVATATQRRIHIHIVRSTKALDGGTGWHSHSMGQLFYVLRGWADLAVERQPAVRMSAGDAMCISPRMKHNVPGFSADYLVLEMCIPADYDTVDAPAP